MENHLMTTIEVMRVADDNDGIVDYIDIKLYNLFDLNYNDNHIYGKLEV